MSQMQTVEQRSGWNDFKKDLDFYFWQRKYQKAMEGSVPIEEKVLLSLTKISTVFILSWRGLVKRAADIVLSAIGVIVTFPVMALIGIAIKMDSRGPMIFKQARVGMRGKTFSMLKFRTMCQDAEALTGPVWAKERDPRVTRVGHFIRKFHLDELPQLVNVLKGEMSLVGPRPERPYFVSEFRKIIAHYDRRLCVKPGITGLAQLKRGYDETIEDVKKKLRYDLLYVQKVCPLLDVKLLAMTVGSVLLRTGR